jgi:hypothetical protein
VRALLRSRSPCGDGPTAELAMQTG